MADPTAPDTDALPADDVPADDVPADHADPTPDSSPSSSSVPPGDRVGLGPARITSIVVGLVVAFLVVLFALGRDEVVDQASDLLGARARPVAGELLGGGGDFDIDDHRGSWVLVNFFATWCPPCVAEHPDLVELEAWGQERGDVQLVSVVFNDPPDRVAQFFAERGGSWPVIDNPTVAVDYRVAQIPESFLVSPSGQIVLHIEGQLAAAEVRRIIEEQTG